MYYKISSDDEYRQVMDRIESYLSRATAQGGGQTLSLKEKEDLKHLSLLAESWEDGIPIMPLKQPQNIVEMLEFKMFERKLKQKELAEALGISPTRLSEVMQGKRKVNMDLAKRLHSVLKVDAGFILEQA